MITSKSLRKFSSRSRDEESIYEADWAEEIVRSQITRDNNEANRSLLEASRNDVSIQQVDGGLNNLNVIDESGDNLNAELIDLIGASDANLLMRIRTNRDLIQEIRLQIENLVTGKMRGTRILSKIMDNFDELLIRIERLESVVPVQSSLA